MFRHREKHAQNPEKALHTDYIASTISKARESDSSELDSIVDVPHALFFIERLWVEERSGKSIDQQQIGQTLSQISART